VSEALTIPRVGILTDYNQQTLDLLAMQTWHTELISESPSLWGRACTMAAELLGQTVDRDDPRQSVCVGRQELPTRWHSLEVGGLWFVLNRHSDQPELNPVVAAVPVYQCVGNAIVVPENGFGLDDAFLVRFLLSQLRAARNKGALPNLQNNLARLEPPCA
jgi:hypothetical protein